MKLVIDANILFAALIKESTTADILLEDKIQLYAPEFLLDEFHKYESLILKKTHRSPEDFSNFLNILKERIETIPKEEILPFLEQADNISPDPKDSVYLALALKLNAKIWSNDRKLKEKQDLVQVITTEEMVNRIKRNY